MKNQSIIWKLISLFSLAMTMALFCYIIIDNQKDAKLIVSQGIIIKDATGKDRILIGSPIPDSEYRSRTDSAKVWDNYVTKYPESYWDKVWEWYQGYDHSNSGIVFLNEEGWARIAIGDQIMDPSIGKRIAPLTGMVIMDEIGQERSGYGVMPMSDTTYRVVLGLDAHTGTEGLALMVDDQGYNAVLVNGERRNIFLGTTNAPFWATGSKEEYEGLIIRTRDEIEVDIH